MSPFLLLSTALMFHAPEPAALTIVWHDSSRLFPSVGLPRLQGEVEELFREQRLSVRFQAAAENENLLRIPEPRVNAILLPEESGRFGVPPNAMAAVLGERQDQSKYTIFIFISAVKRTLGHRAEGNPRELFELSRALARIVAHEVVHVLAPERGHAESGLMAGVLVRGDLVEKRLALDGRSVEIARGKLESLTGGRPAASAELWRAWP